MENPQIGQTNGSSQPSAAPGKESGDGAMIFLAYFGIFGLIPYLTVKDNDFVRWHAKQGLTLTVTWIVLWIAVRIVGAIPVIGWFTLILWPLVGLAGFVLWLVAMIKAFDGQRWRIPVVADLADKW